MASATVTPQKERLYQGTLSRQPRPILITGLFSKNSHSSIRSLTPPRTSRVGRMVAEHVGIQKTLLAQGQSLRQQMPELGGSLKGKRLHPSHPPQVAGAAKLLLLGLPSIYSQTSSIT